jgi:undecaprenyl diphosphate synthase
MNKLNHVAFIMDGNGRVGKKKEVKAEILGHLEGVETVKKVVKTSIKLNIQNYFLCFSSENWKRPKKKLIFY